MKYRMLLRTTLGLMAIAAITTSCTFEQDDYFDESASLRITHINADLKKRLVDQSSEANHGWVIQYFVAGTDDYSFEGFNILGGFHDSGKVTLAGDHRFLRNGRANKYTEYTSTYSMLAEEGPVLAFDTWNEILTVFVDPVDPTAAPGTIANNGEGMFGDQNLVLASYDANQLLFRGERHRAEVRFVPCELPWEEYLAVVNDNKNHIATPTLTSYYVTNGVDTMYFSGLNKGVFTYCERLVDPLQKKSLSCVFTPKGFRINHIDSVGENGFQEFTLAEDNTKLLSEDGKTQVIPCWDNHVVDCPSDWRIDPNSFTTEQAALYAQMAAEIKKVNNNYEMDSIMIGRPTETLADGSKVVRPSLIVYAHGPARMGRVPIYKPSIYMDFYKSGFGQIQFSASTDTKTTASMEMFNNSDLKELCEKFAKTLYGSYSIKPNDYFCPTRAELIPLNGGNAFVLLLKAVTN